MIDIQNQLHKATRKRGIVGAALGLIENGKSQFYFSGIKSIENNDPISIDTVFEIGSITKVFTTLLLMMLSEKGMLNLDDPADIFLPSVQIPQFNGNKITLKHLASHSSGLPSFPSTFIPKNPKNPYRDYAIEDLYYFLKQYTLQKNPGEQFVYSNLGVGLLAYILCLKTSKSYGSLILEHVLDPLSMRNTGVELTSEMKYQRCKGHNIGKIVEFWDTPEAIVGAGGLYSNIRDMTQFLAANLGLIHSPITNCLQLCHQKLYNTGTPDEESGFGWIISRNTNGDITWHDGITGGFRSFLGFNLSTRKGLVVLANSREDWLNEFSFHLLNA